MIEGLGKVLEECKQPGVSELRDLLQELLGERGSFLDQCNLQSKSQRVYRLRFRLGDETRSLIVKRLKPEIARRNELVAQRWLPAIGLKDTGPPVLGKAAARSGECVWHVYQDLGFWELYPHGSDRDRANVAIDLIAQIHTRFANHAMLGEVRLNGGDLGFHFYEANVNDAVNALRSCQLPSTYPDLCGRLLNRLYKLQDELPHRVAALSEFGGPETLLHGDLWAINIFVIPAGDAYTARLIDWDHAAVGPATYDLSTLLLRFPNHQRGWVFDLYRQAVAREGWQLPDVQILNLIFETHEYARFANRIIWPAIALVTDKAEWGAEELAEVDRWFENLEPVLPCENKNQIMGVAL